VEAHHLRTCLLAAVLSLALAPAASAATPCPSPGAHPWCDTSRNPDQRTASLMSAMSVADEEAVVSNQAVPGLGIPAAVANFTDGPVGAPAGTNSTKSGTGLPSASALGASFNPAMASLYGNVTGNDAVLYGYDGIWGPTLNTLRTPLAGRGEEYFGEDPYLIGQQAIAETKAEQAAGAMVQLKHFAGNDQEGQAGVPIYGGTAGGRMFVNVVADDRTLHEIYLAPFEATIAQADPASVMCSYNRLNGPYACESSTLLKTMLRSQLGFRGWVSPDFGADKNHLNNFKAGMDTGYYTPAEIAAFLATGQATQAELDDHVRNILRSFFDHGVFDRPAYTDRHDQIDVNGQRDDAMRIEEEGATLLVNRDGALPLDSRKINSIAVIGDAANRYVRGSGSPEVAPFFHQTLLQGIQDRAAQAGIKVTYNDGSDASSAAATAKAADVAIVSAADAETEGTDKPCMSLDCPSVGLSDLQNHDPQMSAGRPDELIDAVAAAQHRTVVVLQTGEPVLTPWRSEVAGLLEAWYPGEAGGTAIAHVLFGDVDPGGRLSSTFPANDQDGPASSATKNLAQYPGDATETEQYSEGVLVGYRWYDAKDLRVAFPFGFGLSYTDFSFSRLKIKPNGSSPGAKVSLTVKNTGSRRGIATPQLYVGLQQPSRDVVEPPEQLAGFQKVELGPGRSKRVTMSLDPRQLSYWDSAGQAWRLTPGCASVSVGASSRDLPLQGGVLTNGSATCTPPSDCLSTKGRARGKRLGPALLGRPRSRQRRALRRFDRHSRKGVDRYCVAGGGRLEIAYPNRRLRRALHRRGGKRVQLVLASSKGFAVGGVHPGAPLKRLRRRVSGERRVRARHRSWYVAPGRRSTLIFELRGRRVRAVGIASSSLASGRGSAGRFLAFWPL